MMRQISRDDSMTIRCRSQLPTRTILAAIYWLLVCLGAVSTAPAAGRLERDRVEPHWFAHDSRFWYRVDLADGGRQFVLVDAAKGTRVAAFDHARVADALSKLTGQAVAPDRLPIEALDFESKPGAITLLGSGRVWELDVATYAIRSGAGTGVQPASLTSIGEPRPSRNGGADTQITFANHTDGAVEIFWIDTEGNRTHYDTLNPGGEWEQQTYAGHVWLVTDRTGKSLGVYEAAARGGRVVIGTAPKTQPAPLNPASTPSRGARIRRRGGELGSPDGKWQVIVRDSNLVLHNSASGQETQLSHDGKPSDGYEQGRIWWSPDSKSVAAIRVEAGEQHPIYTVESSPADQVQPKLRTLNYLKPGDRIDHPRVELFEVEGAKQIPVKEELFANPWSIEDVRWSGDSSRFTFVYNQRGHQALRVISVDAATGAARAIVDEHSDTFIDYSGKYFCQWTGDNELIWMSERDGWNHLWLYDAQAGAAKNQITRGDWVVQNVIDVDTDRRQILFKAGGIRPGEDPYYTNVCRVNFDGSNLTVLTNGDGTHEVDWSPDKTYLLDRWSRVDQPPLTDLHRAADGKLLCRLETADVVGSDHAYPEPFVAKGRDGATDICGVIFFPRSFDSAKKYPVVEEIYAGPQDFYVPKHFSLGYGMRQEIADRGMIVVQCDGMGTSGRSKKFHDVCFKNLRDGGFPDRVAWITAVARKHPQMDLTRVGIYGGSAGGQNAMAALLWHNDFYKVAVADCGCHDNRMDKIWWNEQWMGWPIGPQYAENSNVVNAHLLQGKLMLMVGEMDDNVDPSSTMQVVNALEKAGKDFDLVIVTGAHHGSAETRYGSKRRMEFLVENLMGTGPQ
jgi:dipeptidyl aminopeptidase/acylaminoacyl peptidase